MYNNGTNINSVSNSKNSKNQYAAKGFSKILNSYGSFNDQATFSPAVAYLKNLNWKIREFHELENKKLKVVFLIDEILFEIIYDQLEVSSSGKFNFIISLQREDPNASKKISIKAEFIYNFSIWNLEKTKINSIKKILIRLFDLPQINEQHLENYFNEYVYDDYKNDLIEELEIISYHILMLNKIISGESRENGENGIEIR